MTNQYQILVNKYANAQDEILLADLVSYYSTNGPCLTKQGMLNELNAVRDIFQKATATDFAKAKALLVPVVTDDKGKKQRIHQWRLRCRKQKKQGLMPAVKAIRDSQLLENSYGDFLALYCDVNDCIGGTSYIGRLTVYDVAKRLWYATGHSQLDTDEVWAVSGALTGLEGLHKSGLIAKEVLDKGRKKGVIDKTEIPQVLQVLDAMDIEDFLCVMHPILTSYKIVL